MTSCVFPGSFDPVTVGHVDLIRRASRIFDRVTVTVMVNIHKAGAVSVDKRTELLRKACSAFENVTIDRWDGLLADYMKIRGETTVIRGVRNESDFEQECAVFQANRLLNKQIDTVFLPTDPAFAGVSSSVVREVAAFRGDISPFVPEGLSEEITSLLSNKE